MAKIKKRKSPDPGKGKKGITDQSAGPQQLYEDRKLGHPDLKDAITADLKRVRHRMSKKIDRRLLNSRKPKSSKSN